MSTTGRLASEATCTSSFSCSAPATADQASCSAPQGQLSAPSRLPLRVWYRYTEKPSGKPRPAWFSKQACLRSLLRALERHADDGVSLSVVADGKVGADVLRMLEGRGAFYELAHGGKCRSFADVLRLALAEGEPGDLVYFAEDDYLYAPPAFEVLQEAAAAFPEVDYFTLYDHPDRYCSPERSAGRAAVGRQEWYEAPSTCLTFAARFETLHRDRRWFYVASRAPGLDSRALRDVAARLGWRMPLDELSWRLVLRERLASPGHRSPRRRLLAPFPGLATHCEAGVLSEGVDWEAIARAV